VKGGLPTSSEGERIEVLGTAINGRADVIATFNIRHLAAGARSFGVAVELPAACCGDFDEPDVSFAPSRIDQAGGRGLARADGVSLNQFVATATAEKVSALTAATYLRDRAARADRARFDRVLARLGSLPPREGDERTD
jgi:hypothetical protein